MAPVTPPRDEAPSSAQIDEIVAAWCARDRARAFLRIDHEVIESTTAVRALIVERALVAAGPHRDLFSACGVLGRLVGERGGSPTLAGTIIDGVLEALDAAEGHATRDASWVASARAALAEGYAAARQEAARAEMRARWEYPTCAVALHEGIVSIAAGYPDDDEDALGAWASRVAHAAALAGVRRAVLGGPAPAVAALEDALNVAGIERLPAYDPSSPRGRPLWKK
jgi:hypothetical protein